MNIKKPITPTKPSSRSALARRVEAREQAEAARRSLAAAAAKKEADARDATHAEQVKSVAEQRARAVGLSGVNVQRFCNRIEAQRRAHVASGSTKLFKAYDVIADELSALGHGFKRPRGTAFDQALPPPSVSEGHKPPPGVVAARGGKADPEAAKREAQADARAAEAKRDREAYQARLRALGLRDPSVMSDPGGSPRFG